MGSDCDESEATVNVNNIRQDSASSEPPLPDDGEDVAQSADAHAEMQHRSGPPTPEPLPSPESLIASGQYLVDCPSWLAFLGEDKRMKYSNHFISRNDKIWELISTEIRFVDLLLVIRDVFLKAFLPKRCDSLDLAENLFPHIEVLLDAHTRLLYHMLAEHTATPDHVAKNFGRCFTRVLTDEMMNRLVEAYGALMFVQSSLSDRLGRLKADPAFAERLSVSSWPFVT
uniref:DH domain-containing protein n=2 Tax=Mesocestoides corti TaxID=53468 RepID=A0A5K3FM69_MESCO